MPEANPIQIDRARSERFFCRRKHLLSSYHQQPGCAVTAQEYSIHPARFQYPRKIFSIIRSRAGIFLREKRQGQARSVCPCIWNSLRGPRLGAFINSDFSHDAPLSCGSVLHKERLNILVFPLKISSLRNSLTAYRVMAPMLPLAIHTIEWFRRNFPGIGDRCSRADRTQWNLFHCQYATARSARRRQK
jgi:hypothetical protein